MTKKIGSKRDGSPAQLIDARIEELGDWRGKTLSRLLSHWPPGPLARPAVPE